MAKTKASARAHRAAEPQAQSEEVAVEEVEGGIIVDQAMIRHIPNRLKILEDKVAEGFAERGRSKKRKKPQKRLLTHRVAVKRPLNAPGANSRRRTTRAGGI